MGRWLRWTVPAAMVAFGAVIAAAGFAYDVVFAGLPYQDPTPEMQARWRYHSNVASVVELSGVGIMLLGFAGLAVAGQWCWQQRQAEQGVAGDRGPQPLQNGSRFSGPGT